MSQERTDHEPNTNELWTKHERTMNKNEPRIKTNYEHEIMKEPQMNEPQMNEP